MARRFAYQSIPDVGPYGTGSNRAGASSGYDTGPMSALFSQVIPSVNPTPPSAPTSPSNKPADPVRDAIVAEILRQSQEPGADTPITGYGAGGEFGANDANPGFDMGVPSDVAVPGYAPEDGSLAFGPNSTPPATPNSVTNQEANQAVNPPAAPPPAFDPATDPENQNQPAADKAATEDLSTVANPPAVAPVARGVVADPDDTAPTMENLAAQNALANQLGFQNLDGTPGKGVTNTVQGVPATDEQYGAPIGQKGDISVANTPPGVNMSFAPAPAPAPNAPNAPNAPTSHATPSSTPDSLAVSTTDDEALGPGINAALASLNQYGTLAAVPGVMMDMTPFGVPATIPGIVAQQVKADPDMMDVNNPNGLTFGKSSPPNTNEKGETIGLAPEGSQQSFGTAAQAAANAQAEAMASANAAVAADAEANAAVANANSATDNDGSVAGISVGDFGGAQGFGADGSLGGVAGTGGIGSDAAASGASPGGSGSLGGGQSGDNGSSPGGGGSADGGGNAGQGQGMGSDGLGGSSGSEGFGGGGNAAGGV